MNAFPACRMFLSVTAVTGIQAAGSVQPTQPGGAWFRPCPDSPNCVSSLSSDPRHAIAPIAFSGSAAAARNKLLKLIRFIPRTRLILKEEGYLRVEFISAVFRFMDDVEFLIDEAHALIHVRSASRVGYWDLGANRRRIEKVRRMMAQDTP